MCLNLALSYGGHAVIASDHRHSCTAPSGTTTRHDYGGKLVRLGNGLVTVGGKTPYAVMAIEALEAAKVDAANIGAVADCLRASVPATIAAVAARWPHLDTSPPDDKSVYFVASPCGEVGSMTWDGTVRGRGMDKLFISFPAGFPLAEQHAHANAVLRSLCNVDSLGGIIRLVAAEFAWVAQRYESVSPTVEIAWRDSYVTGSAVELAFASDAAIAGSVRAVPVARIDTLSLTLRQYAA